MPTTTFDLDQLTLDYAGDCAVSRRHAASQSLPAGLVPALVEFFDVPQKSLFNALGLKKSKDVSAESSELLFRLALVAEAFQKKSTAGATAWAELTQPQEALRNRIPMDLLQTYHGYRYVQTLVEKRF